MTLVSLKSKAIAEDSFVLHPDGYECNALCTAVEEHKDHTGATTGIKLKLSCDGATVHEFLSLLMTEAYTEKICHWRFSQVLVSFGLIEPGDKFTLDAIFKMLNKTGRVVLAVSEFTSKKTGKILQNNKVDQWLPKSSRGTSAAPATSPSQSVTYPAAGGNYDF